MMERFIGITELAEALGISPSTVYFWISKGDIPCYRVGRYRKFKMQEVEEWLKARRKAK